MNLCVAPLLTPHDVFGDSHASSLTTSQVYCVRPNLDTVGGGWGLVKVEKIVENYSWKAKSDRPEERCTAPSDRADSPLPTVSFLIYMANRLSPV